MKSTYEYAVIVGIDGMGNFNKDTDTPNMDRIFENGAYTYYGLSMYPTISAQNWGSMLIGSNPEIHNLTNNRADTRRYENKELPTLFSRVREAFPDAYLASYSHWNPINYGIIEEGLNVDKQTANDETLCGMIEKCIEKKPKLLFIQFDDCDGAGHGNGYGTEAHFKSISKADEYVGRIYEAYRKAGILDKTLFTVIADHGGYIRGHGSYTDGEKYIYLALAGKTVKKGEIPFAQTKDINAIILHGFGLDIPEYDIMKYSSQIPENVFTDIESEYQKLSPVTSEIITEPTPDMNSDKGLLSYFNKDDFKFALFFDNDTKDALGKIDFTEHEHIKYYTEGRYGSYGEIGLIGWLTSDKVKFGKDSFSIGVWLKTDDSLLNSQCYICGTKAVRTPCSGFTFSMTSSGTVLRLENAETKTSDEFFMPFLSDVSNGWIHVLICFDRESMTMTTYNNFKLKRVVDIDKSFDFNYDNMPFTIGNDCSFKGSTEYNKNIFNLDDLFVFDKALSPDEVEKLASYYKM